MILHATDLHFRREAFDAIAREATRIGCDVCISGDFVDAAETSASVESQVAWISSWISGQPFKLFLCSGNQDDDPLNEPFAEWLRKLHDGVRVFTDGNVGRTSASVPFVCLPFFAGPYDSRTLRQMDAARIIVTHVGPSGAATTVGNEDEGDLELAEYLASQPANRRLIVLTGHTHSPSANEAKVNGATVLNPGGVGRRVLRVNMVDDVAMTTSAVELPIGGPRK